MPKVDPADQVQGEMAVYEVPDLASLDREIKKIGLTMRKVRESGKYPELLPKYRADIDLLLDRRRWLEVLLEDVPC